MAVVDARCRWQSVPKNFTATAKKVAATTTTTKAIRSGEMVRQKVSQNKSVNNCCDSFSAEELTDRASQENNFDKVFPRIVLFFNLVHETYTAHS